MPSAGVRSVKEEVLMRLILFSERPPRHVLTQYHTHDHTECPHPDLGNVVLLPAASHSQDGPVRCQERLCGLLKDYDATPHERFPDQLSEEDERRWRRYRQKILNSNGLFKPVWWPCDEWPATRSIPP
jgi:hypothetical protein